MSNDNKWSYQTGNKAIDAGPLPSDYKPAWYNEKEELLKEKRLVERLKELNLRKANIDPHLCPIFHSEVTMQIEKTEIELSNIRMGLEINNY